MKILIIHNLLWTHYKNKLFSELQHVSGDDFEIKVLQIARSERSRAGMESNNLNLDYKYEVLFDKYWEEIGSKELFQKLIERIKNFRPDVVNITGFYSWVHISVMLFCRLRGIKIILSNDSTAADNQPKFWKQAIKKFAISLCNGFFTFGTLATDYMKSLGAKDEQILVNRCAAVDNDFIENTFKTAKIDSKTYKKQENLPTNNFIYVGRFLEIKNLFRLISAFDNAQKQSENAKNWGLILLGEGILREKLQEFVAENKIPNVHFIAGKPWNEVPKFLALADVFVLPSESEPWGLVVNEAMVCQMPVIVSDRCGCGIDLVKIGENGYIFPFNDVNSLEIYLLKFINQEVNIEKMGEVSREIIQNYSPKKVAKTMIQGFRKVLTH